MSIWCDAHGDVRFIWILAVGVIVGTLITIGLNLWHPLQSISRHMEMFDLKGIKIF